MFGENIFGNQGKRSVQGTAHDDCWVLSVMSLMPRLALNLIEILTHKLSEARGDIGALSFLDAKHKIAKTPLRLAV